jgi:hypothetical protein
MADTHRVWMAGVARTPNEETMSSNAPKWSVVVAMTVHHANMPSSGLIERALTPLQLAYNRITTAWQPFFGPYVGCCALSFAQLVENDDDGGAPKGASVVRTMSGQLLFTIGRSDAFLPIPHAQPPSRRAIEQAERRQ